MPNHSFALAHFTKSARLGLGFVGLCGGLWLVGCSSDEKPVGKPCTSSLIVQTSVTSSIDKLDILLAIDNSRSMADKQAILALAVPDLVEGLVNPLCIDDVGAPAPVQPSGPTEPCPMGSVREFEPMYDVHIGVISTSIGGHGADSCPNSDPNSKECAPAPNPTNNDKGRLLSRLNPCGGQQVPTYQDQGFLAWDPLAMLAPPGEDSVMAMSNSLREMVIGAGQIGCGYESQLESVYRFLADPNPYEAISVVNGKAAPAGTDTILLTQRAQFLRPDSMLAILMLTDENDCSIKEYGSFYYVGQLRNGATNVRMPRARAVCEVDRNDECCKSCAEADGACGHDPTCDNPNGGPALLNAEEDDINLRCWDQKRRFGIDFLYPTDRYVQAFRSPEIADRDGNIVPNPIFSDLQDQKRPIRDAGLVFFAGIVGVPWQDIARDPTDLKKGFKDAGELSATNADGLTGWDIILGDPANRITPADPLMIESVTPRKGQNPILNAPLVSAGAGKENPINGHEWTIANDDLQYACIFSLAQGQERDCTDLNLTACDCVETTNDNPLCQPDPNNGNAPTMQVKAKGYPGLRQLEVLKGLGSQGIVGSVCPAQLTDHSQPDYGYRPAIASIIERLKPAVSGQCQPVAFTPTPDGRVECAVLEARATGGKDCACDPAKGRLALVGDKQNLQTIALQDPVAAVAGWDCFCEIPQATGDDLVACQNDTSDMPMVNGELVNAWCYLDANTTPPTGNPDLLAKCPDNEKRNFRFVNAGNAVNGATLFIACVDNATCTAQ